MDNKGKGDLFCSLGLLESKLDTKRIVQFLKELKSFEMPSKRILKYFQPQ